jgi:16S rRNA (guanine966-N2)-methyltransferase
MRIISGTLGGRRINPPAKMPFTRPTTDIAKEGLFNTLQHLIDFDDIDTLDLFGGTGSITYELFSRGAANQIIIEKDPKMASFIKDNLQLFKIENCTLLQQNIFQYLKSSTKQFDFIFAGPPYALKEIDDIPKLIFEKKMLKSEGIFVLEHTPRNNYEQYPYFINMKTYGTTQFSIFRYQ